MNLFNRGARHRTGRNPKPAIFRRGLRISRICETSDRSISVPSTGVANTPETRVHADGMLADFHERAAQPVDVGNDRGVEGEGRDPGDGSLRSEVEATLEKGAVHGHFTDRFHIVVAVDVAQVDQIHRVFRRLLGMAGKAKGPDLEGAPAGLVRRLRGQAPFRLPSPEPPPGEDQAENFPRREDSQSGALGSRGKRRGDTLAGGIEFVAVEGADQPALAHAPPRVRPKIGTQVRANRLGDADAAHRHHTRRRRSRPSMSFG